jgi:hypothetical protein
MYSFRNRIILSLPLAITFLILGVLRIYFTYSQLSPDAQLEQQQQLFLQIFQQAFQVLLIYFVPIVFFSLESLVRIALSSPDLRQSIINRAKSRTFNQNLAKLEHFDSTHSPQITSSIILQASMFVLAFYALTTSNNQVGIGITLSIILQMLVQQWKDYTTKGDISSWFWQVGSPHLRHEHQLLILLGISILFAVFALSLL